MHNPVAETASVSAVAQAAAPLLQVDKVSLQYRTSSAVVQATHEVGFDVYPADRFVLLGPSGCGKSSLLKSVAGFLPPAAGEIRLDGQVVRHPGPDRIVLRNGRILLPSSRFPELKKFVDWLKGKTSSPR